VKLYSIPSAVAALRYSAVKNGRKWIGCDVAILAIKMVREILTGERFRLVEGVHFDVDGIPVSVEQAEELFKTRSIPIRALACRARRRFPHKKDGR
jgi:hypothetical protein